MLIVTAGVATEERSGDWIYRISQPMCALSKLPGVYTVDCSHIHRALPTLAQDADVLIINMVINEQTEEIAETRARHGKLTVFELNDEVRDIPRATGLEPLSGEWYRWFCKSLAKFDLVQFTCEELARRYGRYVVNYTVLENQIDVSQFHPREGHSGFVVGWGGSLGHKQDLEAIAPALTDWIQSKPDAKLALMCGEDLTAPFWKLRPGRLVHRQPADIDSYYRFLSTLDVGLAPLGWSEFNACRSDVKWLEYAAAKVPAIVRDIAPYRKAVKPGTRGLTYSSTEDLIDALERLYNETELRNSLASAAYDYVAKKRTPEAGARRRIADYKEMLEHPAVDYGPPEWLLGYDGASRDGNHFTLRFGKHEWETWRKMAGLDSYA